MPKIILGLLVLGLTLWAVYTAWRPAPVAVPKPTARPAPAIRPPDLTALAAGLGGGLAPPTPAQLAEERHMLDEQIAFASDLLQSAEAETRVEGAEQLGAYLGPKSERLLVAALAKDPAPAVRLAAARSLYFLSKPATATLDALLTALRDADAEVRQAALEALENRLLHLEADSKHSQHIVAGLRKLLKQRKLAADTRDSIREVLADL